MLAAKVSLTFVVVITILGTTQTEPVTDLLVIFIAGGVIPGTDFVLPAELILITVAAALMVLVALLLRRHVREQLSMRALLSQYSNDDEDPAFSALVPGLGKALAVSRLAKTQIDDASRQLYFWLKYFNRPVNAQAISIRESTTGILMRIDQWRLERVNFRESIPRILTVLRKWSDRIRAYLVRVTTL